MFSHLVRPGIVTLTVLGLAACGDDIPTQPDLPAQPTATAPELAVASNTWITRANLQDNRRNVTLATVTNASGQSVVYAIGGYNTNGRPVRTVTAYNVATNIWHFRSALPIGLAATNGAGVVNGKIYVSGGIINSTYNMPSNALYVYDPNTDRWTRKHDMPSVHWDYEDRDVGAQGVTGVINGKLYVVTQCYGLDDPSPYYWEGTCNGMGVGPAFFRYDPATDRWVTLTSPFGTWDVYGPYAGGVIGGKLYVMAGSTEHQDQGRMAAYDPATNRWTAKNALGKARPGAATAVFGGRLYVFGGYRYNATLEPPWETINETMRYDPTTNLWTGRARMPSPRTNISATQVRVNAQARIEVIGGLAPGNNLQYVP